MCWRRAINVRPLCTYEWCCLISSRKKSMTFSNSFIFSRRSSLLACLLPPTHTCLYHTLLVIRGAYCVEIHHKVYHMLSVVIFSYVYLLIDHKYLKGKQLIHVWILSMDHSVWLSKLSRDVSSVELEWHALGCNSRRLITYPAYSGDMPLASFSLAFWLWFGLLPINKEHRKANWWVTLTGPKMFSLAECRQMGQVIIAYG